MNEEEFNDLTEAEKKEVLREKKNVKFGEWAGIGDALGYQQAYETVISNFTDNTADVYCCFLRLPVLHGTVVKVVATRKKDDEKVQRANLTQEFKRIPNVEDIEDRFKKFKKKFIKKSCITFLIAAICLCIVLAFFSEFSYAKYIVAGLWVLYFIWIAYELSARKDGYKILRDTESFTEGDIKKIFRYSFEDDEEEEDDETYGRIPWEQIAGRYDETFLTDENKKK